MILTKEEKIRYVKEYNEGKPIRTPEGFRSRAAFKNSLLNWVKRYNSEGEKGLDRKPGRIPTPEERAAVVRRVKSGGKDRRSIKRDGILLRRYIKLDQDIFPSDRESGKFFSDGGRSHA